MAKPRGREWRGAIATLAVLVPVIGFVVVSSLQDSTVQCDVCIVHHGERVCRSVTAASEEAGIRGGVDNACGMVASGVTEVVRCTTTPPISASCHPIAAP